jgi:hypothetical protein
MSRLTCGLSDVVKLGTLPEWIAAIGTVLAFLVGFCQMRRYEKEQSASQRERRYANARQLVVTGGSGRPNETGYSWDVQLQNTGQFPFQTVLITGMHAGDELGRALVTFVPQGKVVTTRVDVNDDGTRTPQWDLMFEDHQGGLWELIGGSVLNSIPTDK